METAAACPDWSGGRGLPLDLMLIVIRALDIPDLLRAGAVCASWRAACAGVRRVRVPITDSSPCLLYSCSADDDADTATMYSVSSGAAFKVRLPAPAFRRRYVLGSDHGWVIAADEASNLQAFNPLTGAQVDLPPVTGLHHVESCSDEEGRPMYKCYEYNMWLRQVSPTAYNPKEMRFFLYERAYLSCSPSQGAACVILLLHRPDGDLSFARLGDDRWTHVAKSETRGAVYNAKDGLFYLVWRFMDATRQDSQVQEDSVGGVIDPSQESFTDEIELYRVDLSGQKLIKINSSELRGHAIFIGFNSPMLVSTRDFPMFKPNCAYITDDSSESININMYGCREVGIWNFETKALESLGDVQRDHPWLNWPPPIWITPSIS